MSFLVVLAGVASILGVVLTLMGAIYLCVWALFSASEGRVPWWATVLRVVGGLVVFVVVFSAVIWLGAYA